MQRVALVKGLYIHDTLTGESTKIAGDVQILSTIWNTSAEELIFNEYKGKQYNSSIVYLKYSLEK